MFLLAGMLYVIPEIHAQYDLPENKVWVFGKHAGLDFNSGTPVPIRTNINDDQTAVLLEANASVCDTNGSLLFYTNGSVIWDRLHNRMPGAGTLHGITGENIITESSSQGALIVPVPDTSYKYYVFSMTSIEYQRTGSLYYSVVNMQLNGGLGDVEPGRKWVLLDTGLTEKMIAVGGDCDNTVWVIVHAADSNVFKAFRVTSTGIRQPVLSRTGVSGVVRDWGKNIFWYGQMAVSHDRKKIVSSMPGAMYLELYDFNATTGILSNARILDSTHHFATSYSIFGCVFSPDDSKLYVSNADPDSRPIQYYVYQYDFNQGSLATVRNTKTRLGECSLVCDLTMGPDGKIYFQQKNDGGGIWPGRTIGMIASPNLPDTLCQYTSNVLNLVSGTSAAGWLRNQVVKPMVANAHYTRHPDILLCPGEEALLQASAEAGYYEWSNGQTDRTATVTEAGTYWVSAQHHCDLTADTFVVHDVVMDVALGNDTLICDGSSLVLDAYTPGSTYLWSDGSTQHSYHATRSGTYWVKVDKDICTVTDTIHITIVTPPDMHIGADTTICRQSPLRIGEDVPGATYQWNTGDTSPFISVDTTGLYKLVANIEGCLFSDSVFITAMPAPEADLGEDRHICAGKSALLETTYEKDNRYLWNTGDTTPACTVTEAGIYYVIVTSIHGCTGTDSIVLDLKKNPDIKLGNDTVICEGALLTLTIQEQAYVDALAWSDGSTGATLSVTESGRYTVTVMNECGSASDTILVQKTFCDIRLPNVFTPDGDGINDILKALGNVALIENFRLHIFNRWGEQVFFTTDKHTGWDGNYKGQAALQGVYVYMLSYTINDASYTDKGSVTLLR